MELRRLDMPRFADVPSRQDDERKKAGVGNDFSAKGGTFEDEPVPLDKSKEYI